MVSSSGPPLVECLPVSIFLLPGLSVVYAKNISVVDFQVCLSNVLIFCLEILNSVGRGVDQASQDGIR